MLTEQRKLFVLEYLRLRCKNATQAAINAGYSEKSARNLAYKMLKDLEVQGYLEEQIGLIVKELQQEFLFDAIEARKALSKILLDEETNVKDVITVAKDFLDRAGFKLVDWREKEGEKLETRVDLSSLTEEELEKLNDITGKIIARET